MFVLSHVLSVGIVFKQLARASNGAFLSPALATCFCRCTRGRLVACISIGRLVLVTGKCCARLYRHGFLMRFSCPPALDMRRERERDKGVFQHTPNRRESVERVAKSGLGAVLVWRGSALLRGVWVCVCLARGGLPCAKAPSPTENYKFKPRAIIRTPHPPTSSSRLHLVVDNNS